MFAVRNICRPPSMVKALMPAVCGEPGGGSGGRPPAREFLAGVSAQLVGALVAVGQARPDGESPLIFPSPTDGLLSKLFPLPPLLSALRSALSPLSLLSPLPRLSPVSCLLTTLCPLPPLPCLLSDSLWLHPVPPSSLRSLSSLASQSDGRNPFSPVAVLRGGLCQLDPVPPSSLHSSSSSSSSFLLLLPPSSFLLPPLRLVL